MQSSGMEKGVIWLQNYFNLCFKVVPAHKEVLRIFVHHF